MKKRINSKSIKIGTNGDKISIGDASSLTFNDNAGTDKPFSISTWIKVYDVSAKAGSYFSKRHKDNAEGEYYLGHDGGKMIVVLYADHAQVEGVDAFNTMNRIYVAKNAGAGGMEDKKWHNIIVTYNGNKSHTGVTIYLDGTAQVPDTATTTNYNGMGNEAAPVVIGGTEDPDTNVIENYLSDIVIFDKALTADEAAEVYNGGKVKDMSKFSDYSSIISWWKMGDDEDKAGADGIKDYVGSNHGTLAGAARIVSAPWLDTDIVKTTDQFMYRSYGKTTQIKNATGVNMSMPTYTSAAPPDLEDATLGYPTENQRYMHLAMDTFPGTIDNNVLVHIWGYSHAMGRWAKFTKHASGFQNLHYHNNARMDGLQHGQNSAQASKYTFEIAGVDRIYLQLSTAGGGATFENEDKFFMGFNTF